MFQLEWGSSFNNSATSNDAEDNWVANSFTITSTSTRILELSLPISDTFTDQPISALIYQGFDVFDPAANGGLVLKSRVDTTFSSTPGTFVTIPFDPPVDFQVGDIVYIAVMLPGIPGDKFPFYQAESTAGSLGTETETMCVRSALFTG